MLSDPACKFDAVLFHLSSRDIEIAMKPGNRVIKEEVRCGHPKNLGKLVTFDLTSEPGMEKFFKYLKMDHMVKILPPHKPEPPVAPPGQRISVMPEPAIHAFFLEDPEYIDNLGRDPMQQNKIWLIEDAEERVEKLREVLEEYPKQKHRREMLCAAAGRGDEAIVQFFVGSGIRVQPDVEKALEEEKENGDAGDVDDDGSIPDKDDPAISPLHAAVMNSHVECVKIFLESGVDIESRDEYGRTPLIAAAAVSQPGMITYLLGQGADSTARANGKTERATQFMGNCINANALEVAAGSGDLQTVKLLLEHPFPGPTRKRKDREDESTGVLVTPLAIKRAAAGSFEVLTLLLEEGGYPTEDKDGKIATDLLNYEQKNTLEVAMSWAAEAGDFQSLKLMLKYKYPTDEHGNILPFEVPQALQRQFVYGAYNAMRLNRPEKFEFIKSLGVKEHDTMSLDKLPLGQNFNIQHLFERAVEAGSLNCARLMIEKYAADPNTHRLPPGTKPLYKAAANNRTEMVRYLLENHSMNIQLGSGRYASGPTPLWIAISLKALGSIALLLEHGGPVDYLDEELKHITAPTTAILRIQVKTRPEVRLETVSSAQGYVDAARSDFRNMNPPHVRLELGPEDVHWIRKIQLRWGDERLREEGGNARELNEREGVELEGLDEGDVRWKIVGIPTVKEREEELETDWDLMPRFVAAFEWAG
ncbi:uncharacterized protein N0V89_011231 [Didymosphaeria variabile]|uniref:Ankyrin n=1 Tax=Didymosphaeria variabile TaxID=1932322 RepID=A0A9W8XCQ2_9PLEO|nr:uncharacterized protein N0V89_011231 [Didymosphaeria variabile]KAJ4347291.1 hypothetical protein N0V89_011231 [Didymosphaeria variabile]